MQKTRIIILALCLVIVASSVSSYAYARGYLDFLLYEQKNPIMEHQYGNDLRRRAQNDQDNG
jgi:hypothetical protein